MSQPDLLLNRKVYLFILLLSSLLIHQTHSLTPCSYYEITYSINSIVYNPSSPSRHTFYSTIQLNNSQSIPDPGPHIDSFEIYFNSFNTISRLALDDNVLTIGRTVHITDPIDLSVKRFSMYTWEVLVFSVSNQSSGLYTCSIGGCNASESIPIEYIPRILVGMFNLEIPASTDDLKIKCPIEKSLYDLRICNKRGIANCVPNIPMVTRETLDSELYFAPPLSMEGIVEDSNEDLRCIIILLSGRHYFDSQYLISVNRESISGRIETMLSGQSMVLTQYCDDFKQSIPRHFNNLKIFFYKDGQLVGSQLQNLNTGNTGLYTCTVEHEYFRVSMVVLNLTVTTLPILIHSTLQLTTNTPTPNTPFCYVFSYPLCHYYITIPIFGSILLIVIVCICCCISCCCCKRFCCSDRSQEFSVREISSPLTQSERSLPKQAFTPTPGLSPLKVSPFSYHKMEPETHFNGDFTESVLKEVPIFRPHKNQTLLTEMPHYQIPTRTSVLYRDVSLSMPEIDNLNPAEAHYKDTPRHHSVLTHFNMSSTQPPSQSVSIDNLVTNPLSSPTNMSPPPIVPRRNSNVGSDAHRSYGLLPSPTPKKFIENPIFSPPKVPPRPPRLPYLRDPPAYIQPTVQPESFLQAPSSPYLLLHSPQEYHDQYSPKPKPVIIIPKPQIPVVRTDQPNLENYLPTIYLSSDSPTSGTFHHRNLSIPSQEYPIRESPIIHHVVTSPPSAPPTPVPSSTTININIINQESRDKLPPDHFVDFL